MYDIQSVRFTRRGEECCCVTPCGACVLCSDGQALPSALLLVSVVLVEAGSTDSEADEGDSTDDPVENGTVGDSEPVSGVSYIFDRWMVSTVASHSAVFIAPSMATGEAGFGVSAANDGSVCACDWNCDPNDGITCSSTSDAGNSVVGLPIGGVGRISPTGEITGVEMGDSTGKAGCGAAIAEPPVGVIVVPPSCWMKLAINWRCIVGEL